MNGQLDLITLLSLVVAVVVIFKLRSVLGRRTEDDEQRIQQQRVRAQERERLAREQGKVVTLPKREREEAPAAAPSRPGQLAEAEARVKTIAAGDVAIERGLMDIFRADNTFDPEHFLKGARQAYEMIVMAFAEGNRKALKDLLSKEVFEGFSEAIGEREGRAEVVDQSFVGISRSDVVEAELKNGIAQVTVRFLSQLISATRGRGGEVISGDPQKIREVTDVWTFARDVKSRNPNWRLIATQPQS
jgi:predicted lipid-binding transport protein (Tim44 family)